MPPKPLFPNVFPGDGVPRKRRLALALLAVPGLVPAVSHAQLTGAAAQPQPLDTPWDLRLAPQLEEHPLKEGAKPATFVIADHTSGTAEQDLAAKGSAELRRGDAVVKADAIHYDQDTDTADAYGQVRVVNAGTSFSGPEAHLKVEANQGFMTAPKYHFSTTGGSGSAERVDLLDAERSVFVNGTYTACQCATDPAWYIKGSRFDFDTGADEGTARNGVLFFQGVPIFASPWLTFPLSGERRSGLLPPTFSINSNNGFELSLPYYFNIAPNRDLTITPRIITKRGVQTQATFRYLSASYSGTLTGEYLPDDRLAHRNRYAIYWQHQQNFGSGFGGYVYYNKVSDNTYPEDLASISNQFVTGTQTLYQQEAGLTYNNGPWSVLARYQHWQTLPPSSAPPYGREPQLNVKYTKYNVGGFDFGAEADYSRFRITTADTTQGDRVVFNPYIAYGIYGPGYFAVPKVQYHFASYDLSYVASNTPNNPKRFTESIPTVSFDSGLIFDRSVRLFGQDFIQTLEPRLYYVYTPYRNQSNAPLFDTAESDFGLAEIYQPNTFVGNDRFADANRLTAGLTSRFIDPRTGDERARFMIAQQYYFTDQRVTLKSTPAASQARHSDLIAGAALKLGSGFASETAFQYNQNNNQLVKSSIGFGYSPELRKVINVGYRYTRATQTLDGRPINQFLVSAQWPLTRRLYAVGRFNYDFSGDRVIDGLVGLQYDADCWALGVGIQRYANGVNSSQQQTSATRFMAQLTLKGLSSIDNGLVNAFRAGVPGYMPLPPAAPPLSRFSNYD
ncbi:LPS biosynthesis protein [Burkholderia stagnalis]|uniref:LPS-assembly protein LptD n=1 Tax=Burkholderia stagnalis TaxID=1503054 RepID=A0A6L3MMF5_9BURK|nr:LPS-assembly protein LptD [Burkholderia stagnalis]KAB0632421.1 LPS-assembly protein LptD [Burkholderia stagnalis]KVN05265.1 LPS biosynthesis protein [Burkholderia stagnalis]KVO51800.1 LPS biosynthesis protein [Burkholderia stagnalis]KVO70627.1 LPS biosynthesis protein [Burkholderia stagnalis]KVW65078.1 LPS biosynthesis protein [Burkholderia stagnalis]